MVDMALTIKNTDFIHLIQVYILNEVYNYYVCAYFLYNFKSLYLEAKLYLAFHKFTVLCCIETVIQV